MRVPFLLAAAILMGSFGCSDEAPPSSALTASYHAPTPTPLSCLPTLDGTIQASQLQAAIGVPENFLASPAGQSEPVDLAPQVNAAGQNVWDYSAMNPTDQLAQIEASSLASKWYASSFPNGTWTAPVDLADTEEVVYSEDSQTIWLYGFASSQENPSTGQTLLVYDNPIPAYQLPLAVGNTWTATSSTGVGGMFDGLPWAQTDTYTFAVDNSGVLELPELTFTQVLRVRSVVSVQAAIGSTTPIVTRQTSLLFQCFGEVYRATSQPGETNDDFTTAAEIRRFSLETQP